MPKYRVYVAGTLDWDYDVEAEDEDDAGAEAEALFAKEFGSIMWSAIEFHDAEEIKE